MTSMPAQGMRHYSGFWMDFIRENCEKLSVTNGKIPMLPVPKWRPMQTKDVYK